MIRIDSTSQLLSIIRQQANSVSRGPASSARAKTQAPGATKERKASRNLGELIAQRVLAIDPDAPHRKQQAFHAFLEAVLIHEFGDELINDPAFYRWIDEIQHSMEQDEHLRTAMDRAADLLLQTAALNPDKG